MADRPEYLVRLRALPDSVPAVKRLARFLKGALRAYGLQCLGAREVGPGVNEPGPDAADANVGDGRAVPGAEGR